jgi:hypothetical protein
MFLAAFEWLVQGHIGREGGGLELVVSMAERESIEIK